jgi:hypothetical protein
MLVVLAVIAGLVFLHLTIAGPVPSGGDGGNWLAVASERLGADVLTPGVGYPPLFPFLLAMFLLVMNPVPALVVCALLARSIAVLAVYLAMRGSGRVTALITALLVALAAFQLEAYAWGAYPQILASGVGVLATHYTVRFVTRLRPRDALLAVLASAAVFATHTLVAGLLLMVLPIAVAHAAWVSAEVRRNWRSAAGLTGLIVTLGVVYLASSGVRDEGRAVLNPAGLDIIEGARLAAGESLVPWIIVGFIGISSLTHRRWEGDRSFSVSVGFGWVLAGFGVFLVTGERRSLLLAEIGLLMLAATEMERFWQTVRSRRLASVTVLVLSAAIVGSILVPGVVEYGRSTDFYRIVDRQEIDALRELERAAQVGDIVVASRGRNTIPIGWWVEGITRLPAISGHDPRFLTFPAEIEEAEAANSFFDGQMTPEESVEFLSEVDARFLVVDRRGPDAQWLEQADGLPLEVILDSSSLVIFRVEP